MSDQGPGGRSEMAVVRMALIAVLMFVSGNAYGLSERVEIDAFNAVHVIDGAAFVEFELPSEAFEVSGKLRETILEIRAPWTRPGLTVVAFPVATDTITFGAGDVPLDSTVARLSSVGLAVASSRDASCRISVSLRRLVKALRGDEVEMTSVLLGVQGVDGAVQRWPADAISAMATAPWVGSLTVFTTSE